MLIRTLLLSLLLGCGFSLQAEGNNGGDDFRNTASEYRSKATKYRSQGKPQIAALYTRMAAIKANAANLADQNRWDEIDWSEYHKIEAQINKQLYNSKKYK